MNHERPIRRRLARAVASMAIVTSAAIISSAMGATGASALADEPALAAEHQVFWSPSPSSQLFSEDLVRFGKEAVDAGYVASTPDVEVSPTSAGPATAAEVDAVTAVLLMVSSSDVPAIPTGGLSGSDIQLAESFNSLAASPHMKATQSEIRATIVVRQEHGTTCPPVTWDRVRGCAASASA